MNQHTKIIPPTDISGYYERMTSSLPEKLFFLELLPRDVTVIADFGCGDGALLRACRSMGYETIGYDHSEDAIALAIGWDSASLWTPKIELFKAYIQRAQKQGKMVCLVLSSVIHEVLSEPGVTLDNFWNTVIDLGCEYVAIRDMAVSETLNEAKATILQYLLKYHYTSDLEKELLENYFPVAFEELLWKFRGHHRVIYSEHYLPKWWHDHWKADLGIELNDPTHYQAFLELR